MSQKLKICDYHRNGVSGRSFKVGIVNEQADGQQRRMLVIRPYDADDKDGVECYVFDLDKLAQGEIRFFHNSWRGDHYHEQFDYQWESVKAAQDADGEFYNRPIEKLIKPRAAEQRAGKE